MSTSTEVTAVIESINNLRNIVTGIDNSTDKQKLLIAVDEASAKVIAMGSNIKETLEALSSAKERAETAERKCMELENFSREAECYILQELVPGFFVYAPKPGMKQGEPVHYLCATCFASHQKSFIQRSNFSFVSTTYTCDRCKSTTTKS